jgi:hypothetical protein
MSAYEEEKQSHAVRRAPKSTAIKRASICLLTQMGVSAASFTRVIHRMQASIENVFLLCPVSGRSSRSSCVVAV